MSLIARGRPLLCNGSISKHIYSPAVASSSHKSVTRLFAQTATSENLDRADRTDRRRLLADYVPANSEPTKHRSPPSERIRRLVDEMDGLSLVEAAELSVILVGEIGYEEQVVLPEPSHVGQESRCCWCCRSCNEAAAKAGKKPKKTAFGKDGTL